MSEGARMETSTEPGLTSAVKSSIPAATSAHALRLHRSAVTQLNLIGYLLAFLAVCWYNYTKFQSVSAKGCAW